MYKLIYLRKVCVKKMKIDPIIKWSGSKRSQAQDIIKKFEEFDCYYEPFLGGGSVMYAVNPSHAICGDICEPLIGFWKIVQNNPQKVIEYYTNEWNRLQKDGYNVFYDIRSRFNIYKSPLDLLFLSRTCVNGLIRFNTEGNFNNSFHHTRKGIDPKRLEKIVIEWHKRIANVQFICGDYRETTQTATKNDIIYLDPPYENTKGRYYGTINYEHFYKYLEELNRKEIKYVLSFDGIRGEKEYETGIPKELYVKKYMLQSGNSSFKKVMDKSNEQVYEALYLNW